MRTVPVKPLVQSFTPPHRRKPRGRLPRREPPVAVKLKVVLIQLGEMWPDQFIEQHKGQHGALLDQFLERLAQQLGCTVKDLRLDHDPALGARQQVRDRTGKIVRYIPDEHDTDHLRYRPHGPQFAGSHLIKTNVRGDRGQYPDRVLIKRERRSQEKATTKKHPKVGTKKRKIPSRPFQKAHRPLRRKP